MVKYNRKNKSKGPCNIASKLVLALIVMGTLYQIVISKNESNIEGIFTESSKEFLKNEKKFEAKNLVVHNHIDELITKKALSSLSTTKLPKLQYHNLPEIAQGMTSIELVISGIINLVNLKIPKTKAMNYLANSHEGIYGEFCRLNWNSYKSNPAQVSKFRYLVKESPHCNKKVITLPMDLVIRKIKENDNKSIDKSSNYIKPTGFVFHESRCGSTLVANCLASFHPTKSRVYSESHPPAQAIKACPYPLNYCYKLFQDIIHLMGRRHAQSLNEKESEKYLFFKFQSVMTLHMNFILKAFPRTPWIFLYRHPIQVMMSHFSSDDSEKINCLKKRFHYEPHSIMKDIMYERKGKKAKHINSLSDEEYCALHLSSLCHVAFQQHQNNSHHYFNSNGLFVNYDQLPNSLTEYILPLHFHVNITKLEKDRILNVSGYYSKQMKKGKPTIFQGDNEEKVNKATSSIIHASNLFLMPIYSKLNDFSFI